MGLAALLTLSPLSIDLAIAKSSSTVFVKQVIQGKSIKVAVNTTTKVRACQAWFVGVFRKSAGKVLISSGYGERDLDTAFLRPGTYLIEVLCGNDPKARSGKFKVSPAEGGAVCASVSLSGPVSDGDFLITSVLKTYWDQFGSLVFDLTVENRGRDRRGLEQWSNFGPDMQVFVSYPGGKDPFMVYGFPEQYWATLRSPQEWYWPKGETKVFTFRADKTIQGCPTLSITRMNRPGV